MTLDHLPVQYGEGSAALRLESLRTDELRELARSLFRANGAKEKEIRSEVGPRSFLIDSATIIREAAEELERNMRIFAAEPRLPRARKQRMKVIAPPSAPRVRNNRRRKVKKH